MKPFVLFTVIASLFLFPTNAHSSWASWTSERFSAIAIPAEWKQFSRAEKINDWLYVSDWRTAQLNLKFILKELGLPDRLQKDSEGQHYLLYRFEGDHIFIVYLGSHVDLNQPPLAAALQDRHGKTSKLIK